MGILLDLPVVRLPLQPPSKLLTTTRFSVLGITHVVGADAFPKRSQGLLSLNEGKNRSNQRYETKSKPEKTQ